MRFAFPALTASLLLPALLAWGADPSLPSTPYTEAASRRTLSESGQFSVLGGTSATRSEFAKRSDGLWTLYTKTAGQPTAWQHRIIVQIHDLALTSRPERRAAGRIFPLEQGGYRFQLDVLPDADFRWDEYRRELTKLFLLRQSIGPKPAPGLRDRLPPWLLTGTHELLNYRQNGVPSQVYALLMDSRQMLALEDLLQASPNQLQDSISASIFSACGAALVQALLDLPNGPARFQALLTDLGTTATDPLELLHQHFPSLRQDPMTLEKWWALQIATMSQRHVFTILSFEETERRLDSLLHVLPPAPSAPSGSSPVPTGPGPTKGGWFSSLWRSSPAAAVPDSLPSAAPLHLLDLKPYLQRPWAKAALREKLSHLTHLQTQAFPLHQPILAEYHAVLESLPTSRPQSARDRLNQLDQDRQALHIQMRGVEDHINWFSATQIEELSSDFDSYSQALKLLDRLEQRKRPDPVSRYLDAVERELNP